MATGHGENIIENNVCLVECFSKLNPKELLQQVGAMHYDLGLISIRYLDGQIAVNVVSTGAALIYGFVRKNRKAKI